MLDMTIMEKINFFVRYKFFKAHSFKSFYDNTSMDSTEKSQPRNYPCGRLSLVITNANAPAKFVHL